MKITRKELRKLAKTGKLRGTQSAAIKKAESRRKNPPTNKNQRITLPRIVIPLSESDQKGAHAWGVNTHPRLQNWNTPKASNELKIHTQTFDCGRYSSRCWYTHYTYTVRFPVFAIILKNGNNAFFHHLKSYVSISAPAHWIFSVDQNGFCIRRKNNSKINFHPMSNDVENVIDFGKSALKNWCKTAAANHKKIAQKQKIDKIKLNLMKNPDCGLLVHLSDSLSAGNCAAGVENFREKNQLGKVVPAWKLWKIKENQNDDTKKRIEKTLEIAVQIAAQNMIL